MLPAEPVGGPRTDTRASDADRDRCVELLRDQCGQGRLTLEEFEERIDIVFAARTLNELDGVLRDLPVQVPAAAPPVSSSIDQPVPAGRARRAVSRAGRLLVAILGETSRRGRYAAPSTMTAVAVVGECLLDLTQATFTDGHLFLRVVAALGSITVLVPDGAHVDVGGLAILGEKRTHVGDVVPAPGAPVVTVRVLAVLGEVEVRVLSQKERIKREQRARAS